MSDDLAPPRWLTDKDGNLVGVVIERWMTRDEVEALYPRAAADIPPVTFANDMTISLSLTSE